jgi:hypothetical protein
MILPPSGELTDFSVVCAVAEHALTVNKLNSNPASFQKRLWIRIATTSPSFLIFHPQRDLAEFLQQDFEDLYRLASTRRHSSAAALSPARIGHPRRNHAVYSRTLGQVGDRGNPCHRANRYYRAFINYPNRPRMR